MAKFTFKVGDKIATGNVERVQIKVNITYQATGKCPYCNSPFKIGFNPGDIKSKGSAESDLRSTVRRHYRNVHGGK